MVAQAKRSTSPWDWGSEDYLWLKQESHTNPQFPLIFAPLFPMRFWCTGMVRTYYCWGTVRGKSFVHFKGMIKQKTIEDYNANNWGDWGVLPTFSGKSGTFLPISADAVRFLQFYYQEWYGIWTWTPSWQHLLKPNGKRSSEIIDLLLATRKGVQGLPRCVTLQRPIWTSWEFPPPFANSLLAKKNESRHRTCGRKVRETFPTGAWSCHTGVAHPVHHDP